MSSTVGVILVIVLIPIIMDWALSHVFRKVHSELSQEDKNYIYSHANISNNITGATWVLVIMAVFISLVFTYPNFYGIFPHFLFDQEWSTIKFVALLFLVLFYWSFVVIRLIHLLYFRNKAWLMTEYSNPVDIGKTRSQHSGPIFSEDIIKTRTSLYLSGPVSFFMILVTVFIFLA
jgi:hypothetical protein